MLSGLKDKIWLVVKSRLFWKIFAFFCINSLIITFILLGLFNKFIFSEFKESLGIKPEVFHSLIVRQIAQGLEAESDISEEISEPASLAKFNRPLPQNLIVRTNPRDFFQKTDQENPFPDESRGNRGKRHRSFSNERQSGNFLPRFHKNLIDDFFAFISSHPSANPYLFPGLADRPAMSELLTCLKSRSQLPEIRTMSQASLLASVSQDNAPIPNQRNLTKGLQPSNRNSLNNNSLNNNSPHAFKKSGKHDDERNSDDEDDDDDDHDDDDHDDDDHDDDDHDDDDHDDDDHDEDDHDDDDHDDDYDSMYSPFNQVFIGTGPLSFVTVDQIMQIQSCDSAKNLSALFAGQFDIDHADHSPSLTLFREAAYNQRMFQRFSTEVLITDSDFNYVTGNPAQFFSPFIPIISGGTLKGFYFFNPGFPYPESMEEVVIWKVIWVSLNFTGRVIIFCLLFSAVLLFFLLRPIGKIREALSAFADQRFDARIDYRKNDEFGELAKHFNTMAQNMENFIAEKMSWASVISHELKTPLTILRGEIEAVQDGVRELTEERLESIRQEIIHLTKLTEDLRCIASFDRGTIQAEKQPIEINGYLDSVCTLFSTRFEQNALKLVRCYAEKPQTTVMLDAVRFKQALSNLLENNIRYTPPGDTVFIDAFCEGENCIISVEDNGKGIDDADLVKIFEPFYRVEKSRNRALGGRGLGLTICRQLVELHKGDIRAEKSLHGGLKITVRIPLHNCEN